MRHEDAPQFNDIFADVDGRIYAGSLKFDPFSPEAAPSPGELYRVEEKGRASVLYGDVGLRSESTFRRTEERSITATAFGAM